MAGVSGVRRNQRMKPSKKFAMWLIIVGLSGFLFVVLYKLSQFMPFFIEDHWRLSLVLLVSAYLLGFGLLLRGYSND